MKAYEILSEAKKQEAPKPRNFVAKNQQTSGSGAHKDKKKAEKQGDFKHKKQEVPMDEGLRDPKDNPCWKGYKPVGTKKKGGRTVPNCVPKESVEEMYGRKSSYYNPMDYERDQQRQMDREKRDFKRREMEHELGDEEEYYQQQVQKQRDLDRGPWYLKINGKILKSKGEPKVFDWKKGANNYGLAILKNKPELQGKIMLTKKAEDDLAETATAGSTSAGNVAVGAVYKNKPPKQPKNKDGTAKNALDMKANLLTGGSIKR
jgi:hypothetical protein